MLTLSIKQPWSWLIVNGHKDIENRDWPTKVRGNILVHAGLKFDHDGYEWIQRMFPAIPMPGAVGQYSASDWQTGGIVGMTEILDCSNDNKTQSPWFFGDFGFLLGRARTLPFMPMKGRLGFFETEYDKSLLSVDANPATG